MNVTALIYNVSLVVGLVLVGVGVGLQWGVALALVTVGALILFCSMFTAHIASRG